MTFPSYRARYLPAMTLRRIRALPDRSWAPVILATGAIEQHGPHLPVAVDALMGQVWLSLALARLPAGASCYVAPPITIGKSNEHTGFPGTLMISRDTLRSQILAVARQVAAWGFRSIAVINTHGGNVPVLAPTLREVRAIYGLRAGVLQPKAVSDIPAQEAAFGIHAGEVETSWVMAAAARLADPSKAACEFPARIDDPGEVRPVAAPALFAWASRDVSKSGIMGDATAATAEKGERWLEQGATSIAAAIAEVCRLGREPAR
ncbi:MAG TPA: creatininase family protein [Candidatus Sulfotelmatobacter sp.]|nr:creatininase family protein [Candidatus Sulfotelmatobacter sp.]